MKKIVLAGLLCVLLAGCHGAEGSLAFEVPDTFDESISHEITFWAKNDTNKNQTDIYEKAIRDFQKAYPNITVNMRLYTDYGRIYNDVITNIATDTTPNVCITYPDHIATYMTKDNNVVALDSLFASSKYGLGGSELKFEGPTYDEMIPYYLDECRIGGLAYAIPYMRSTEALYVNKTLVEKLGYVLPEVVTWDFMFEVAEKAVAKGADGNYKVNGQKVMIPIIYKSTDNMMIQMLAQKGAGYSTDSGEILLFNDTTKELLYEIGDHAATGAFSTFKISSYPANFMNAGQCIFAIDSTAGSTWMGTDAPMSDIAQDKIVKFETAVRMVPQFDPDDPKMISQGPSICIFNKQDPQEVLASWLFAQYLLTNDVQVGYAETEGYVPVTYKAQNSPEYQQYISLAGSDTKEHYFVKIDASLLLQENVQHTFTTPVFNGSTSVRDAAGQMIENVAKSRRRNEKVDDAYMEKLFSDVSSLYHLDGISSGAVGGGKRNLGPLPTESKVLLGTLVVVWAILAVLYFRKSV